MRLSHFCQIFLAYPPYFDKENIRQAIFKTPGEPMERKPAGTGSRGETGAGPAGKNLQLALMKALTRSAVS